MNQPTKRPIGPWSFCWGMTYPLWISHTYYDGDHYTLHLGVCSVGYSP